MEKWEQEKFDREQERQLDKVVAKLKQEDEEIKRKNYRGARAERKAWRKQKKRLS